MQLFHGLAESGDSFSQERLAALQGGDVSGLFARLDFDKDDKVKFRAHFAHTSITHTCCDEPSSMYAILSLTETLHSGDVR